jgi:hypothetical protein
LFVPFSFVFRLNIPLLLPNGIQTEKYAASSRKLGTLCVGLSFVTTLLLFIPLIQQKIRY